jgi:hypothetical protein
VGRRPQRHAARRFMSTRPASLSSPTARLAVLTDTPYSAASSSCVGRMSPARRAPHRMAARKSSAIRRYGLATCATASVGCAAKARAISSPTGSSGIRAASVAATRWSTSDTHALYTRHSLTKAGRHRRRQVNPSAAIVKDERDAGIGPDSLSSGTLTMRQSEPEIARGDVRPVRCPTAAAGPAGHSPRRPPSTGRDRPG